MASLLMLPLIMICPYRRGGVVSSVQGWQNAVSLTTHAAMSLARRCRDLYLTPREEIGFDLARLFSGQDGLTSSQQWIALAPHLAAEVPVSEEQAQALRRISPTVWRPFAEIAAEIGAEIAEGLCALQLLVRQDDADAAAREARVRDQFWHPLAALAHAFGRWSGTDSEAARRKARFNAIEEMVAEHGPPPPHFHARSDAQASLPLPRAGTSAFDELCSRRATCRNFDLSQALPLYAVATVLQRVFGAQGSEELAPGAVALKKHSPSGGSLHSVEAYLLVRRVEGLAPGWYHYHAGRHALDRLAGFDSDEAARAMAHTAVAGQDWFADAPVQVMLTSRFARAFWKYRNHSKIYRAIVLEAGHLSQNLYLAATELGLGAFITAAINEVEIEQALSLDPMSEGVLAVCGFGVRSTERQTVELDPNGHVWAGGTG